MYTQCLGSKLIAQFSEQKLASTMILISEPRMKHVSNSRPVSAGISHILQSRYAFPFFFFFMQEFYIFGYMTYGIFCNI